MSIPETQYRIYSFQVEKYSSCSTPIETRSQSSDLPWDHFAHRDHLTFEIQCRPTSQYAAFPICKIRVLWHEQTLEEVDIVALATRNIPNYLPEQKCISFLGRPPILGTKYYNEPTQTLRRFQIRLTKDTDYHNIANLLESFKCPVRPGSAFKSSSQNRNSQNASSIPSSPSSICPQNELVEPDYTRSCSTPSAILGSPAADSRPGTASMNEILRSETEMFSGSGSSVKPAENVWNRGIPLDVTKSAQSTIPRDGGSGSMSLEALPPLRKPTPLRKITAAKSSGKVNKNSGMEQNVVPPITNPTAGPFSGHSSNFQHSVSSAAHSTSHGTQSIGSASTTFTSNPSYQSNSQSNSQDRHGSSVAHQQISTVPTPVQHQLHAVQSQQRPFPSQPVADAVNPWDWKSVSTSFCNTPAQRQYTELPSLSHYGHQSLDPSRSYYTPQAPQPLQDGFQNGTPAQRPQPSTFYSPPFQAPATMSYLPPATPPPSSPVLAPQETIPAPTTTKGKGSSRKAQAKKKVPNNEESLFNTSIADLTDENIDDLIVECIHDPEFADFLERIERNWKRVGIEAVQTFRRG